MSHQVIVNFCALGRVTNQYSIFILLSLFCLFTVVSYSCSLPSRQPAISSLSLTPARLYSKKDMEYGKLVLFMFSQSLLRLLLLALVLVCSFDRPIKCHTLLCVGWELLWATDDKRHFKVFLCARMREWSVGLCCDVTICQQRRQGSRGTRRRKMWTNTTRKEKLFWKRPRTCDNRSKAW